MRLCCLKGNTRTVSFGGNASGIKLQELLHIAGKHFSVKRLMFIMFMMTVQRSTV